MGKNEAGVFADASHGAESPCLDDAAPVSVKARNATVTAVGQHRPSHIALRRAKYVAYLLYWTARHRSISNARWVLAFEGISWN